MNIPAYQYDVSQTGGRVPSPSRSDGARCAGSSRATLRDVAIGVA